MTATPEDSGDAIEIKNGDTEIENGGSASWAVGSNTLTVKVIDEHDPSKSNTYTVTVYRASQDCEMTSFSIDGAEGVIAEGTVSIEVPNGTDVTNLTPVIGISESAACSPASGVSVDFTDPVEYIVTAEDGVHTSEYVVTVTVAE